MFRLRRLISILCAYAAGSIVAGVVFVTALMLSTGEGWRSIWSQVDGEFMRVFVALAGFVSGMVALLALVPALAAGAYTERHCIRSPVFYAIAGGAVALVSLGLYAGILYITDAPGQGPTVPEGAPSLKGFFASVIGLVAATGVLSGLTYWAIAGRNAGSP